MFAQVGGSIQKGGRFGGKYIADGTVCGVEVSPDRIVAFGMLRKTLKHLTVNRCSLETISQVLLGDSPDESNRQWQALQVSLQITNPQKTPQNPYSIPVNKVSTSHECCHVCLVSRARSSKA